MKQSFKVRDKAEAQVDARPQLKDGMHFMGFFVAECYSPDGGLKWRETGKNLVVNEGLNHALDVIFHGSSQVSPWYTGVKTASGGITATDVLSAHGGWTEFTDYSGNRKEYVESAASGQSIDNTGSPASFSITGSGTVAGAFLCSVASGSAGVLFCCADFATTRTVDSGDTVNVSYTLTSADDGV